MEATGYLGNERRVRIRVWKQKDQDSRTLPSHCTYLAGDGYKTGIQYALLLIVSVCGIHWDLVYSKHNQVREERCQKPSSPTKRWTWETGNTDLITASERRETPGCLHLKKPEVGVNCK